MLKEYKITIDECPVSVEQLSGLLKQIDQNVITNANAKNIFNIMIETNDDALAIIKREGFSLNENSESIEEIVLTVFKDNPQEADRFKNGEQKLLGFFMGQVMKITKGRVDPTSVSKIIRKLI